MLNGRSNARFEIFFAVCEECDAVYSLFDIYESLEAALCSKLLVNIYERTWVHVLLLRIRNFILVTFSHTGMKLPGQFVLLTLRQMASRHVEF
jgi:hypothetical protein